MRKRNRPDVATVTPTPEDHSHARVWGGLPGECGVECACGLLFDGFETRAAARNAHWDHYLDSIPHPAWCDREWCGEGGGDMHGTPERRIELPDDDVVMVWLQERHGAPGEKAIRLMSDSAHGFSSLTVDQAVQLRDAIDQMIATATGNPTSAEQHIADVFEACRVGRELGKLEAARDAINRKPAGDKTPVNRRRTAKSTDCKVPAQRAAVTASVPAGTR